MDPNQFTIINEHLTNISFVLYVNIISTTFICAGLVFLVILKAKNENRFF